MQTNEAGVPLTVASVSQGAGTDGTSLMAEMMCVASTEASGCNKSTQGHQFEQMTACTQDICKPHLA